MELIQIYKLIQSYDHVFSSVDKQREAIVLIEGYADYPGFGLYRFSTTKEHELRLLERDFIDMVYHSSEYQDVADIAVYLVRQYGYKLLDLFQLSRFFAADAASLVET